MSELDVDADSESYDILDENAHVIPGRTRCSAISRIKGAALADRVVDLWYPMDLGVFGGGEGQADYEPREMLKKKYIPQPAPPQKRMGLELMFGGGKKRHPIRPRWTTSLCPVIPRSPLNALYQPPRDRNEAETLRQYISQMRQELAMRLVARLYADGTGKPSKWWLSISKRRFMGKSL
jgi:hypothetical protein